MDRLKKILCMSDTECQIFLVKTLQELGYKVVIGHDASSIDADYLFAYPPSMEIIPVLLMAHWDTVRTRHGKLADEPVVIYEENGKIENGSGILGADDRAGISMILDVIEQFENRPILLFTNFEEIGGHGMDKFLVSKLFDPFKDSINLTISCDRKGHNQYVMYYTNADDTLEEYMTRHGYVKEWGTWTDGAGLATEYKLPHVNVSYGGYLPHNASEFILVDSYVSGVDRLASLIEDCNTKFIRQEAPSTYKKHTKSNTVVTPASHDGKGTAAYDKLPSNTVVMTDDKDSIVSIKLTACPCEVCGKEENVFFNTKARVFLCTKCVNRIWNKYHEISPETVRAGIQDLEQGKRMTREANVLLKPKEHVKKNYPSCPVCGKNTHVSWSRKLSGFVCTECSMAHSIDKEKFKFDGRFWVRSDSKEGLVKIYVKGEHVVEVNNEANKLLKVCSPSQHEWLKQCALCGEILPIHTNDKLPLCTKCHRHIGDLVDEWEDTRITQDSEVVGSEDIPF